MKTVIVGVTGSIAAYKTCDVVSALRKEKGVNLHVIMTPEATKFVSPLTFQTLSGNPVYSDLFEAPEQWDLLHTTLSAKADLVLICPATLNILSKLANGIADDLLSCTLFATRAPVMAVPAMNTRMYEHPVTQENLKKLKHLGVEFVGPVQGELACRDVGIGHIAEHTEVVKAVQKRLKSKTKKRK
jgi:phosphopantothenoylcysteine decarboxylase / phosphopantothenate---cysteine ligase